MENLSLNAEIRAADEKISTVRNNKQIPAVVYGKNQEPISIKLDNSEFIKTFRKAGESHLISLNVGKKSMDVLVHDVQRNPVTDDFKHIDLYAVTKGEAVTTNIHISFTGNAPAAKSGCVVTEMIKEIEVKCLPKDLVDSFEVSLESLKEDGDAIRVSDINISDKFELVSNNPEDVVANATATREEVIEDTAPEAELPEAENGGDKEEEEA